MKSIEEANVKKGMRVLIRVDWNMPTDEAGTILDASRIEVSLPTIEYVKNKEGIPIIASHFGREEDSMEPVIDFAKKNYKVLAEGVEFLENLRKNSGEENNNENFARELTNKADIYVNEAFSVSHREHASIVKAPEFLPHFAGFRFLEEYKRLSEAFNPEHPFLLVLGGVKFETKLPLVEKFLEVADYIFIGGALAVKASEMSIANNSKIIFPIGDYAALDANAETLEILAEKIKEAKFVLWNGPLGDYEKGFVAGTVALSRMLAESNAKIILGGGDTLVLLKPEIKKQISPHGFISTAGGAMLEFLANGTLPGIEALK
ncbi:MAG: phosphoglycerate kinase [Candidatus Zambryskibacteria bacterium]